MKLFTITCTCLLAAALLLAGCASGSLKTPVGCVDWQADSSGQFVTSGSLPPGYCIEVEFFDSDGMRLGEPQQVTPPSVSTMPKGTKTFVALIIEDCNDSEAPGVSPADDARVGSLRPHYFFGGPVQAIDGGTHFAMTIDAVDPAAAAAVLESVLANMETVPAPPSVEVHLLQRQQLSGSDVLLTLLQDDAWIDCDVAINGNTFAGLADATRSTVNGWDVLTYTVPGTEFDYAPGADWENEVQFTYTTLAEGTTTATFGLTNVP